MFTGLVECLGRIDARERAAGGARLIVWPEVPLSGVRAGESIAVNGACLTAEPNSSDQRLIFYLSEETLARTTLGRLEPGASVNLERALRAGDRLGGHFVSGHVDAVGEIRRWERRGEGWWLEVEHPEELTPLVAPKGSIAVDGISLTVADAAPGRFGVAVIPHTARATTLGHARVGQPVNLEADLIARYVRQILQRDPTRTGLSERWLREAGF